MRTSQSKTQSKSSEGVNWNGQSIVICKSPKTAILARGALYTFLFCIVFYTNVAIMIIYFI